MADNSNTTPNSNSGIQKLINAGAEVAGGAIGGALGFLAAGPAGAAALGAAGAAAASALKHIGEEASERLLAPREKVKVGGVLALIAAEVNTRTTAGEKPRSEPPRDLRRLQAPGSWLQAAALAQISDSLTEPRRLKVQAD